MLGYTIIIYSHNVLIKKPFSRRITQQRNTFFLIKYSIILFQHNFIHGMWIWLFKTLFLFRRFLSLTKETILSLGLYIWFLFFFFCSVPYFKIHNVMYAKYKNKTCRRKKLQFQCNEVKKNVSYYTNIFPKSECEDRKRNRRISLSY